MFEVLTSAAKGIWRNGTHEEVVAYLEQKIVD